MTATCDDRARLHRLIDRLPPAQLRRLRALVAADPELSEFLNRDNVADQPEDALPPEEKLSWIGIMTDGPADLAERHDDYVRAQLHGDRPD